jgi:DNA-binding NarL/FixJ family response regulator
LTTSIGTVPILLASDFPILRDSLKTHFQQVPGIEVVGCANNEAEVESLLQSLDPKLVMLDLNVDWEALCSLLERIRSGSSARSLIITDTIDSKHVIQALRHGAHGVVPRRTTPELLTKSIHTVLEGGFWISRAMVADFVHIIRESGVTAAKRSKDPETHGDTAPTPSAVLPAADTSNPGIARLGLTNQEVQIVGALAGGHNRDEIAKTLGINEDTVKQQLANIYSKLGVYNNLDLVLFGWIDEQLA